MKKICLLLIISFFLVGCFKTPTSYQKYGATGGFKDSRCGDNSFKIDFSGNGHSKLDVVKDYALLRAAEIASRHDYEYFTVLEEKSFYKIKWKTHYNPYGGSAGRESRRPRSLLTIICSNDKPEDSEGKSYNVKETLESLKAKHNIGGKQ